MPSLLSTRTVSLLPIKEHSRSLKRYTEKEVEDTFCKGSSVNSLLVTLLVVLLRCLSGAQLLRHIRNTTFYVDKAKNEI